MSTFRIKRGDTRPYPAIALAYSDGSPVVLDEVLDAVAFKVKGGDGVLYVNSAAVITDGDAATGAEVEYRPSASDFAELNGSYLAEWEVTFSDGTKQTFPTVSYDRVIVTPDLDGT